MEATAHVRRGFAEKFRSELDRRSIGVRTLARTMAGARPQRVDILSRQLRKYLRNDHVPTEATRHAIEDALGIERDTLKPDDPDEEEGDPPLAVTFPIQVSIDYDLLARAMHRAALEATG